jgi:hypothetical protein
LPADRIQRTFIDAFLGSKIAQGSLGVMLKARQHRIIGTALAVLLLIASTSAQAFRCGTRIISRGDHSSKLLRYCGEPDAIQTRLAQRQFIADVGHLVLPGYFEDVWVEEWTYNFGPSKLMRVVRVENGIVAEIRHLGYGYSPR